MVFALSFSRPYIVTLGTLLSRRRPRVAALAVRACSRILTSIGGGAVTGILGYTGLSGFLAYILFYILGSLLVLVRGGNGFSGSAWFASSSDFWTGGLSQGVMTFVLFWTLFYDIVHVY